LRSFWPERRFLSGSDLQVQNKSEAKEGAALSPPLSSTLKLAGATVAGVIAGRNLPDALASALGSANIAARPAVMDLAYGVLRHLGRYRFFLRQLLTRGDADAAVTGILLAALHALHARPGAEHTVVDQAVVAVSAVKHGAAKGLVNAVLRNYLRRREALAQAAEADESALYNYPAWWIARVRAAYPDFWQAMLEAGNQHPPMSLRVNRRKSNVEGYLALLQQHGLSARALGGDALMLDQPVSIERLPGFDAGLVSVQDYGAQLAAPALDAADGMRVLDACAAPGGKTGHLLELADVELTAVDIDEARLKRVRDNLHRLGLTAKFAAADCADIGQAAGWWDGRPFDRILLDAPCSASGVARRHPDAKWLRRDQDVAAFVATQSRILDALWRMLGRGGKLLYATCSVFPEENAERIAAFLEMHRDASLIHHPNNGQLQPEGDHDGFYHALLGKAR
jgi:16S rRNA (cytosine967-C5)-methyltransferase